MSPPFDEINQDYTENQENINVLFEKEIKF